MHNSEKEKCNISYLWKQIIKKGKFGFSYEVNWVSHAADEIHYGQLQELLRGKRVGLN